MKVLVDLRCLNYKPLTGVNAYCIRLLNCLYLIKKSNKNINLIGMGLEAKRWQYLCKEFDFLENLFDKNISLNEYLGTKIKNKKINEILINIKTYIGKNINSNKITYYDYIVLPQPRSIVKNKDSKIITVIHDIFSIIDNTNNISQKIVYSEKILKKVIKNSSKILVNSISTGNDIKKRFGDSSDIKLIYPSIPKLFEIQSLNNKQNIVSRIDILTRKPFILALSGIERRKNWINTILAYKMLKNRDSINLVLAGTIVDRNYYESIKSLIKRENIQSIVWIISPNEIEKEILLKKCSLFVYPSIYEGFGFPILEALQFNKKILTSKLSSIPEVGKDRCFYANPFNYEEISFYMGAALTGVCEDQEELHFEWEELLHWLKTIFK
jgi:glycosyltransferase involved in cell wall biosynthesis